MTVFVVHPLNNGVNIEDAKRFGEIEFINQRYAYPDETTEDGQLPVMFRRALDDVALRFSFNTDYLLIAGDHLQLIALSARLGSLQDAYTIGFQVLRWVRDANAYMPVRIHT